MSYPLRQSLQAAEVPEGVAQAEVVGAVEAAEVAIHRLLLHSIIRFLCPRYLEAL
jgi:hypothetical protein